MAVFPSLVLLIEAPYLCLVSTAELSNICSQNTRQASPHTHINFPLSLCFLFYFSSQSFLHLNSIGNSACNTRQNCRTFLVNLSFVVRSADRRSAPSVFGDSAERSTVPSRFIWLLCSLSRRPTWHFSLALTPSNKLSERNSVLRLDSCYAIRRQLGSPGKSSIKSWSVL